MNKEKIVKNIKRFFDFKGIGKQCSDIWSCHSKLLFSLFSLVILASGIYLWYQSLYRSEWSNSEKKQYIDSQSKQTELDEQGFKNVTGEIERKKELYDGTSESAKDIFAPYAGDTGESTGSSVNNSVSNSASNSTAAPPIATESNIAPMIPR
jgi:hypothetical protein